ncbi:class I adenylate-forming enzyme family protein [Rhodococcoides fascians]|uniref:class I adenylate-forming enzyme family protein n=1 Tax=Rhodococcoides fascians TaxID=1828 RepID=UPI00068E4B3C|nr:AMP-binding protein [Rhodococcus fascians]
MNAASGSDTTYAGDGSYTTFNVLPGDWLRLATRRAPDNVAFVLANGETLTFRQVSERVNQLADLLVENGVGTGDRVATMATESMRHIEVMLATLKIGATFMPLNFRLSRDEVDVLLDSGKPRLLFHSGRYESLLAGIQDKHTSIQKVVCLDHSGETAEFYDDAVRERPTTEPPARRAGAEDIAILAYTSGTTGMPKGVQTSYRMAHACCMVQILEMNLSRDDFFLTSSPLFHSAGYFQVLMCLYLATPVLVLPQFDPVEVQRWLARDDGPTAVFLVPTMLHTVMETPGAREAAYPRLRLICYGGAPMPPALLRSAMALFGCDFANCFGAGTENGAVTWLTPADHRRAAAGEDRLLGSVGRPGVGVELRICDDDLNDLPVGEIGEIVTRNNSTMSGYLDMPDRSARTLPGDGWFRAGDLGYLDADGYLWLSGRANDMIIRGGENIYPLEIEHVLAEHPSISEIAVVGVEDERWGESVRAWVVLRSGSDTSPTELAEYCTSRLASYKVPTEFWFVAELPKNASGKLLKRKLVGWSPEGVHASGGSSVRKEVSRE